MKRKRERKREVVGFQTMFCHFLYFWKPKRFRNNDLSSTRDLDLEDAKKKRDLTFLGIFHSPPLNAWTFGETVCARGREGVGVVEWLERCEGQLTPTQKRLAIFSCSVPPSTHKAPSKMRVHILNTRAREQ